LGIEPSPNDPMTQLPNDLLSAFRVLPGADVHFSEQILRQLDQGKATTVGDGGKFLFVEFPSSGIPYRAEEVLFQLRARGIVPVVSHPERNMEIAKRPQRYYEMVRTGCLGQVTAMSLTGGFGSEIRRVAEKLLTHRLLHFIASDAHSVNGRSPVLSSAVRAAEEILGEEEARKMVTEYPRAILEGRKPDVPEPHSP
jgi:protein-tyrosine phosphatase